MRAIIFVVAVGACLTVVEPVRVSAQAQDSLSGLRGVLEERQHRIDVTIGPGHATLVVQRTVENLGRRHDQADWQIHLPSTAVATLLRTRGMMDGAPRWFVGELMEAEAAAAKYRELTGIGGYYPEGSGAAVLAKPGAPGAAGVPGPAGRPQDRQLHAADADGVPRRPPRADDPGAREWAARRPRW